MFFLEDLYYQQVCGYVMNMMLFIGRFPSYLLVLKTSLFVHILVLFELHLQPSLLCFSAELSTDQTLVAVVIAGMPFC